MENKKKYIGAVAFLVIATLTWSYSYNVAIGFGKVSADINNIGNDFFIDSGVSTSKMANPFIIFSTITVIAMNVGISANVYKDWKMSSDSIYSLVMVLIVAIADLTFVFIKLVLG